MVSQIDSAQCPFPILSSYGLDGALDLGLLAQAYTISASFPGHGHLCKMTTYLSQSQ
jgi:hypothetical protein